MPFTYDYSPLVSIIIPAYNASNYLAEAIDSALAQTYPNIEIIVVNDGSKDDDETERIALSYGDKIRYIHKANGGSSSALNAGIANMRGEWFSWLSHDDLYYPSKIEKQIEFLNTVDGDVSKYVLFTASELINADGKLLRSHSRRKILNTANRVNNSPGNEYLISQPTHNNFHGCSCLVHKNVFTDLGGFDESLRLLNDIDMWFRIYSNNYKVRYIPEVLVKGRVHSKQVSTQIGYSYHNPEQDMFWDRSLMWLKSNFPNNYELFYKFGKNAYLKTRTTNGDDAFEYAKTIRPNKKFNLVIKRIIYVSHARIISFAKKTYLSFLTK